MTPEEIRHRLGHTSLSGATEALQMPPGSNSWPADWKKLLNKELKSAGVLIPLIIHAGQIRVLLTQRSAALKHHAAQVAFPGGRVEEDDADIAATALRETHEEVGIPEHRIEIAGYLPTMPTVTGYAVTPIVGIIDGPPELRIDTSEVEYAFEVPLEFLLDEANDVSVQRQAFGEEFTQVEFHWQRERIWGATAHMILAFRQILLKQ